MNGLQIFAFVALPLTVAAIGWLAAFAVVRSTASDEPGKQPRPEVLRHHV